MVAVTILGVVITGGGYGLAWADHETYVAGEPDDLTEKMTISAGGWAAVSGGYSTLGRDFTSSVFELGRTAFGDALRVLPRECRGARAVKRKEMSRRGLACHTETAHALIGFLDGSMRAFVLEDANDFEPVEVDRWLSPDPGISPDTANDVFRVAQAQIAHIRKRFPKATVGRLSVAKAGSAQVVKTIVPLLLAHAGGRAA